MGDNKVIVRNAFIMYFKLIVVSLVGLFSSRFVIQALGSSDFGLYSVVGSIVFMMAFLNNVMVTTTYRFIAFELGKDDISSTNKVFNVSLVIHMSLALLVFIIGETVGAYYINNLLKVAPDKLHDALFVFHLSIFGTIINILSVPYQGLLIAKEKFSVSAVIEIVRSFLTLGAVFLIQFYSGNKLRLYASSICIISIIPCVMYYLYTNKLYSTIIAWKFQSSKVKYKEMASFSGWIMFGAAASASEIQGSILLINIFFGTIINASYGVANQVNTMVKMFAQSLNQTVIPKITKSYSSNDNERMMELVILTSKFSFFLILFPSLPILLETDFILKLWIGKVPVFTSIFVQLFIINAVISTMNAGIPSVIQATGRIKYFQIILGTLAICGLPVSYVFYKLGSPPYTLAIIYVAITIVDFFVALFLLKRIINFNIIAFFKGAYLKMILVCLTLAPLFFISLIFSSSVARFLSITVVSEIWLFLGVFFLGMNESERKFVLVFLKKITSFLSFKKFSLKNK